MGAGEGEGATLNVALPADTEATAYWRALDWALAAVDAVAPDALIVSLGFGRRALESFIDHVRTRPNATELFTSYVPGEGSPGPFYIRLGFEETGEVDDGENVVKLVL